MYFSYSLCVFFSCFVCLFSIVCYFVILYCISIVPPSVYSCLFPILYKSTDRCHRVETQLQSINIISYSFCLVT